MLSKGITIIQENRLIGYVKLQQDVLEKLKPNEVIMLERELNVGDTTINTFRLKIVEVGIV